MIRVERDPHYLRQHRRRLGFTQDEVAQLTGCKSGRKISKYELFQQEPSLRTALACEVIFRVPGRRVFAGLFEAAQLATAGHAKTLLKRLEKTATNRADRKLDLLRTLAGVRRASRTTKNHA